MRNVNNCIYVNCLNTHCEADLFFTFRMIYQSIDREREREKVYLVNPAKGSPLLPICIEVFDLTFFISSKKYLLVKTYFGLYTNKGMLNFVVIGGL